MFNFKRIIHISTHISEGEKKKNMSHEFLVPFSKILTFKKISQDYKTHLFSPNEVNIFRC